jgi:hypothetical protein
MRNEEFNNICRSVGEAGAERFVQHLDSMYAGKVLACGNGEFIVEAFGHRIHWPAGRCRPVDRRVNPLGPPSSIRH